METPVYNLSGDRSSDGATVGFAPVKGQPPYWFRDDPAEVEHHRLMVSKLESLYRASKSANNPQHTDAPVPSPADLQGH